MLQCRFFKKTLVVILLILLSNKTTLHHQPWLDSVPTQLPTFWDGQFHCWITLTKCSLLNWSWSCLLELLQINLVLKCPVKLWEYKNIGPTTCRASQKHSLQSEQSIFLSLLQSFSAATVEICPLQVYINNSDLMIKYTLYQSLLNHILLDSTLGAS